MTELTVSYPNIIYEKFLEEIAKSRPVLGKNGQKLGYFVLEVRYFIVFIGLKSGTEVDEKTNIRPMK